MSLEEALNANTAELAKFNANFAAMKAATEPKAEPAADKKASKKKDEAPAVSFEDMKAALFKVKSEKGAEAAQSIIKDTGKAAKMAEIKPENFAAVLAACEVALAPAPAADDDL
jgi:hypothetical protein